jgi:hypothetical protein
MVTLALLYFLFLPFTFFFDLIYIERFILFIYFYFLFLLDRVSKQVAFFPQKCATPTGI